jgi:hypothetical protein
MGKAKKPASNGSKTEPDEVALSVTALGAKLAKEIKAQRYEPYSAIVMISGAGSDGTGCTLTGSICYIPDLREDVRKARDAALKAFIETINTVAGPDVGGYL